MCLPYLVEYLQNQLLIVTTLSILKCNIINSCLESSTVFSKKILWRCLTFVDVYTITKSIYVFSIEGSEYIQFFASPYLAITANRSGP